MGRVAVCTSPGKLEVRFRPFSWSEDSIMTMIEGAKDG